MDYNEKVKRDYNHPIRIRLKGGTIYAPGDRVTGVFEILPEQTINCRGVDIKIGWRTEGKGRRDEQFIYSERYHIPELPNNKTYGETFAVELPDAPWSYAGHYINIVWFVLVNIDIPLATDIHAEQRFVLQPAT
jgi:hypothetical protein